MTELIQKYNDIMNMYRQGKFGKDNLTLAEILEKAGEADLLDKMNVSEIQHLLDNSSGMTRMLFSNIKKLKENDPLEMIGQQNFDIPTTSSGIDMLNKNNLTKEKPLMKVKK